MEENRYAEKIEKQIEEESLWEVREKKVRNQGKRKLRKRQQLIIGDVIYISVFFKDTQKGLLRSKTCM